MTVSVETDITSRFIAAVLMDQDVLSDSRHRLILGAALALLDDDQAVDVMSVADHLAKHGLLESAGGREYLIEVVTSWS
jgi:replicative DNA helicase